MPSNADSLQNSAGEKQRNRQRKRKDVPCRNAYLTESAAWRVERLFTHLDRAQTSAKEIRPSRDASPIDQRGSTSSVGQPSLIASPLFIARSVSDLTSSADDCRSIRIASWHTDDSPSEWKNDENEIPSAFTLSRSGEAVTRRRSTTLGSALDAVTDSNSLPQFSSDGDGNEMSSSCPRSSSINADLDAFDAEAARTVEEHSSRWDDILRQDAAEDDGQTLDSIFCSVSQRNRSSSKSAFL